MTAFAPPAPTPTPAPPAPVDAGPLAPEPVLPLPPPNPNLPPPVAADPFLVESIIAAVGLDKFLNHELRRVHQYNLDRAARLGEEVDREIYKFINSTGPEDVADLPPFDFMAIRDMLTTPAGEPDASGQRAFFSAQQTADIIGAFGDHPDVGMAAAPVVERIQSYLASKLPKRVHMSLAGPVQQMPGHSDVARFRRTWSVAITPLDQILGALRQYALSRGMVDDLQAMYPLVWQRMNASVDTGLARKRSVEPNYYLSIRKEQLLRILVKREDATSRAMGVALQAQFKSQAAQAAPKPPKQKREESAAIESSAADRIGQG